MKKIAVYCGSNYGENPEFTQKAQELGKALADNNLTLVYGGGKIGLMGVIADSVLNSGGEVIGVIPTFLKDKEMAHPHLSELIITPDMATRKNTMMELADGFIAMPGGLGTLEELFEVLSSAQLQLHNKPSGLYNIGNFYEPFIGSLQKMVDEKFMPKENLSLLCINDNPLSLLAEMRNYEPTFAPKWQIPSHIKDPALS